MRSQHLPIDSEATESWTIAPEEKAITRPAYFLPGQLDRVTACPYSDENPYEVMAGNREVIHRATRAFVVQNALLLDGGLYQRRAMLHLHRHVGRLPKVSVDKELDCAALYCTTAGIQYFGQWLLDDCLTYPLAEAESVPLSTDHPKGLHTDEYEHLLQMTPLRSDSAYVRELIMFEDIGQNQHKHSRRMAAREKLVAGRKQTTHPGVFLLRGVAGERRILVNEIEIAEMLAKKYNFKVIDPMEESVDTIVETCLGADTVVGVEGSALVHGVQLLKSGGNILVLQPPDRFVWVFKDLADRDRQNFGFVVGSPDPRGFRIELGEVEATLALFPN